MVGLSPFEAIRALDAKDLYKILTEAEDSILLQFQILGVGGIV